MLDKIINQFCGVGRRMETPSLLNGFVYATDGYVLVKAPEARFAKQYNTNDFFPDCEAVMLQPGENQFSMSVAAIQTLYDEMPKANIYADCTHCDAEGQTECDCCGHSNECDYCNGTGESGDITGTEVDPGIRIFAVGDYGHINPNFMNKLCALAEVIGAEQITCVAQELTKSQFSIDNVTIIVMNVKADPLPNEGFKVVRVPTTNL